jgi:ACS family pantothenate transporter-like MFS transporter
MLCNRVDTSFQQSRAMGFLKEAFGSSYGNNKPKFFGRSDISLSEQGTDLSRWYPHGTPAKEKKLLTKIDFFILTYCCLG